MYGLSSGVKLFGIARSVSRKLPVWPKRHVGRCFCTKRRRSDFLVGTRCRQKFASLLPVTMSRCFRSEELVGRNIDRHLLENNHTRLPRLVVAVFQCGGKSGLPHF